MYLCVDMCSGTAHAAPIMSALLNEARTSMGASFVGGEEEERGREGPKGRGEPPGGEPGEEEGRARNPNPNPNNPSPPLPRCPSLLSHVPRARDAARVADVPGQRAPCSTARVRTASPCAAASSAANSAKHSATCNSSPACSCHRPVYVYGFRASPSVGPVVFCEPKR